jgi:predicted nucleic acid-binding protein
MTPDPPAGARCFVDANILGYHFVRHPVYSAPCWDFMQRVQDAEISACTSPMMVTEALHRIMLAQVQTRFLPPALAHVQRHPEIIQQLTIYPAAAAGIATLSLDVLPVESMDFASISAAAAIHKLLTDDASTVALMQRHGIQFIATNDDDFDRIPGITACKPR